MSNPKLTSERQILRDYLLANRTFPDVSEPTPSASFKNPVPEEELGAYRNLDRRKAVTADFEVIEDLRNKGKPVPTFREAGPREHLVFDFPKAERDLKVAIVTSGGLAPGLNSVVHSIVERHLQTYAKLIGREGGVWGFLDSFNGLSGDVPYWIPLNSTVTETWLDKGGSELGNMRGKKEESIDEWASNIGAKLARWEVDILYVIGGDGSLGAAHAIAKNTTKTIIVGVPKTMDNDILWVWQSFGFNTAVERARGFINALHAEVEGTRRVCVLEFFGAQSGYVAANATLASGHVDLVLIPEVFGTSGMVPAQAVHILTEYREHLKRAIRRKQKNPHGVVVLAEGVATELEKLGVELDGKKVKRDESPTEQISNFLRSYQTTEFVRPAVSA